MRLKNSFEPRRARRHGVETRNFNRVALEPTSKVGAGSNISFLRRAAVPAVVDIDEP
jgi:hypothetical protein